MPTGVSQNPGRVANSLVLELGVVPVSVHSSFPLVKQKTTEAILMGTLNGTSVGKTQMLLNKYEVTDCTGT